MYRIIFRAGRWKSKSERHFAAFSVDEAVNDFYHVFVSGHVHANYVKIFTVDKYDRFADEWTDVTNEITTIPDTEKNIKWKNKPSQL